MAGHLADDLMAVARTFGCRSQPVRHVNVVAVPNSTGASLPVWCRTRSACARDGAHGASEQRLTRICSPPCWLLPSTDTFIIKTKKLYSDSRTQRNLDKLNSELRDVHSIMTKNINELLERGDRLERTLGGATTAGSGGWE